MNLGRGPIGWAVGALAVAAVAALLWFGLASTDGQHAGTATPVSSGGDILPPPEEDADRATTAGATDQTTEDIIPPDEP